MLHNTALNVRALSTQYPPVFSSSCKVLNMLGYDGLKKDILQTLYKNTLSKGLLVEMI